MVFLPHVHNIHTPQHITVQKINEYRFVQIYNYITLSAKLAW
jgi:hypothetical protein